MNPLKNQPPFWAAVAAIALPVTTAILVPTLLTGCGSSAKVETPPASVGQQLQDLEKARNDGLLTEAEYQQQRKKILEGK